MTLLLGAVWVELRVWRAIAILHDRLLCNLGDIAEVHERLHEIAHVERAALLEDGIRVGYIGLDGGVDGTTKANERVGELLKSVMGSRIVKEMFRDASVACSGWWKLARTHELLTAFLVAMNLFLSTATEIFSMGYGGGAMFATGGGPVGGAGG